MLVISGWLRGTSLHPWMSTSGVCSNWRLLSCADCTARSHDPTVSPRGTGTRIGTVLMNIPTMLLAPSRSVGRPEVTDPKSTSELLLYFPSTSAQAAWTTVLRVMR